MSESTPMATKTFGGATDEQAKDLLKAEMTAALSEVVEIVQAAFEAGYFIDYATGLLDGQQAITRLEIVKRL